MKILRSALAATAMTALATPAISAQSDILFVLDGSGSMWGQIQGEAKISTAKNTMVDLMDSVPADARVGLMTYGTTSKSSCTDVSVLNGLGASRDEVKASIQGLKPLGKTPIQTSLIEGISLLTKTQPTDVQKSLVLVSDGIETCDGDPCAVAGNASASGVDMKIHVVGFDVDAEARAQLECIAEKGNGQYFNAADTDGFKKAMEEVVQVAQAQPEPEPKQEPVVEEPQGPTITEFFRDDFDGSELAEHWAVENPNPENFVIDGGKLIMISTSVNRFSSEAPINLVSYTGDMPDGDWDASITFTAQMPTRGAIDWGLRKDKDGYIGSVFYRQISGSCQNLRSGLVKMSGGKPDSVNLLFRGSRGICGGSQAPLGKEEIAAVLSDLETKPITLTLSKRGRSYTAKTTQAGINITDDTPLSQETSEYTSLRSPGTLSFTIGRYNNDVSGELYFEIDSVVINKVEQ